MTSPLIFLGITPIFGRVPNTRTASTNALTFGNIKPITALKSSSITLSANTVIAARMALGSQTRIAISHVLSAILAKSVSARRNNVASPVSAKIIPQFGGGLRG